METQSSSDEDDDHRRLIHPNTTTSPKPRSTRHHPPPLQIDNITTTSNLTTVNKRYIIFAISLPLLTILLLIILLFFQSKPELRAIYLLKQQQLGLIKLYNRTSLNISKSALLNQIVLNNQIQHVLLSSRKPEDSLYNDNRCRSVVGEELVKRKIEWKPVLNKYLFVICTSGQMSNHLVCLEKHMFFAAVLGRVLVIPSAKVDYEFGRVLDVERINECLGRKVVVMFEEFAETKKDGLRIDKFICYFSLPQKCFVDDGYIKKLESLGVSMSKVESAWVEDVRKPTKKSVKDVIERFSSDEDVIAIGDVFFADVENEWVMQPGGPIAHKCKTLIEPSRLILMTAQRFVQTFLGGNFVALHFRRHGFLKFCNIKTPSCFYPVPQAAECITRIVERANAPVIYLATDAAESETDLLQSLVLFNLKTVPLVKRPARNSAEKWDALLYRNHIEGDAQVEAMLDKTICALSSVFIGSSGSTFTEDILRLRKDWGSASQCDEYLCQGEQPNFVAEDEDAH